MNTKEVMTRKVITISADQTMTEAHHLMLAEGICHLPVVDEQNVVVGILNERGIQRAMQISKFSHYQQNNCLEAGLMVKDFMSWPVYFVSESTSVERVAEEMLSQDVSAFLVQDNLGVILGIVTNDDLLEHLNNYTLIDPTLMSIPGYFSEPQIA